MNMDDNNFVEFEEAKPEKDNRKTVIIVAAAVILVCCCCILAGYLSYQYLGDPFVNWLRATFNL
jgi:peptidoglycan/LPS O-acetylase OafA/YrhL